MAKVIGYLKSKDDRPSDDGGDDGARSSVATRYSSISWIKGRLIAKGVNGAKLIEWKEDAVGSEVAIRSTLGLVGARQAKHFYEAISRHVGLCGGCLADDVGDRPARAVGALTILDATHDDARRPAAGRAAAQAVVPGRTERTLGPGTHRDERLEPPRVRDERREVAARQAQVPFRRAHGHDLLPSAAKEEPSEHPDENVASTLGNLAKQLVFNGAYSHALEVCAEWLGVASAETGREKALEAYCNLWKRHGSQLSSTVDLSRKARGH